MKVTYQLSRSECMSSHSSKWRKGQPFFLNHTIISPNMITYRLRTSELHSSKRKWSI